jgi:hypothetical protein
LRAIDRSYPNELLMSSQDSIVSGASRGSLICNRDSNRGVFRHPREPALPTICVNLRNLRTLN